MAKQLTVNEILFALGALTGELKRCDPGSYVDLACELGDALGRYGGFDCHSLPPTALGGDCDGELYIGFSANSGTPSDGGVLAPFDPDVSVADLLGEQPSAPIQQQGDAVGQGRDDRTLDYLVIIEDDLYPIVRGPLGGEPGVMEAAQAHRQDDADGVDGLYRLMVGPGGAVRMESFGWLGEEDGY